MPTKVRQAKNRNSLQTALLMLYVLDKQGGVISASPKHPHAFQHWAQLAGCNDPKHSKPFARLWHYPLGLIAEGMVTGTKDAGDPRHYSSFAITDEGRKFLAEHAADVPKKLPPYTGFSKKPKIIKSHQAEETQASKAPSVPTVVRVKPNTQAPTAEAVAQALLSALLEKVQGEAPTESKSEVKRLTALLDAANAKYVAAEQNVQTLMARLRVVEAESVQLKASLQDSGTVTFLESLPKDQRALLEQMMKQPRS